MLTRDDDESYFELSPANFFEVSYEVPFLSGKNLPSLTSKEGKKFTLPSPDFLTGEETFASIGLGYNLEGIALRVEVQKPVERVFYPEIREGDSFEVFIDTRDLKTTGYATRFCHHFFFLPELVDGRKAGEITRFRGEESHPIADHNELSLKIHTTKKNYTLEIFIPSHCLYGFDPVEFDRIGFTYRINRPQEASQHFTVLSDEFKVEDQPSLWSSLTLKQSQTREHQ
ncbi:hypothetical protein [Criblamydia sequanensis]|uniref:Carbohydrate-binding domain-containing protein n=1 Tax=Candidatus Criblamydia sequanensis CRIB-18 TaxID=1437425 RepID=A0A090CXQ2_9BACT|nr:hypothetical protein [Criblamydia sequanensis]CDR32852.1 conserved hypothetical protein [Criblamydia sequanensis CRIB-18]